METEVQLLSPPTSLVPRIHVIFADKIAVNNPLLPPEIKFVEKTEDQDVDVNKNADGKEGQSAGELNGFMNSAGVRHGLCELFASLFSCA